MDTLQAATEKICDLKGSLLALDALMTAILHGLPQEQRATVCRAFMRNTEMARTVLLHTPISDHTIAAFERDAGRLEALMRS